MRRRTFLTGAGALTLTGCGDAPRFSTEQAEAAFPPIGRFVEAEGVRVHCWAEGRGQPVVLVHGASGNLRDWTFEFAPRLAKTHWAIAVDRPGFGYTERPSARGYDPAVQARILARAVRDLGARRPIVVGHSWGAALAMSWGLQFPEDVAGVVAVSGVTQPYGGLARVIAGLGLDSVIADLYSDYLRETAAEGGIGRFVGRIFRPQEVPEGYLDYVGAPLALRDKTLDANGEDIQFLNEALRRMAPDYPTLRPPLEIVHGRADFIDYDDHALPLAAQVPGARSQILPNVGHMAHHAAPGALMAAIGRLTAV